MHEGSLRMWVYLQVKWKMKETWYSGCHFLTISTNCLKFKLSELHVTKVKVRVVTFSYTIVPMKLTAIQKYKIQHRHFLLIFHKKKTSDSAVSWLLICKIIYVIQFAARGRVNIYTFAYRCHTVIGMKSGKIQTHHPCLLKFQSNFKWNEFSETRQDGLTIKDS